MNLIYGNQVWLSKLLDPSTVEHYVVMLIARDFSLLKQLKFCMESIDTENWLFWSTRRRERIKDFFRKRKLQTLTISQEIFWKQNFVKL